MFCWHILFYLLSIHLSTCLNISKDFTFSWRFFLIVFQLARSQYDDDEESTTIPLSTTTNNVQDASWILSGRVVNNSANNDNDQTNNTTKQRIIIALAVLCAALAVLLGFLVYIVVRQWWQHDKDKDFINNEPNKVQSDFVSPSYNSHQTIKL